METTLPDYVDSPFYDDLQETIKNLFSEPQNELEALIKTHGQFIYLDK